MANVRKGMQYNISKAKGKGLFKKLIIAILLAVYMYAIYLVLGVL